MKRFQFLSVVALVLALVLVFGSGAFAQCGAACAAPVVQQYVAPAPQYQYAPAAVVAVPSVPLAVVQVQQYQYAAPAVVQKVQRVEVQKVVQVQQVQKVQVQRVQKAQAQKARQVGGGRQGGGNVQFGLFNFNRR